MHAFLQALELCFQASAETKQYLDYTVNAVDFLSASTDIDEHHCYINQVGHKSWFKHLILVGRCRPIGQAL